MRFGFSPVAGGIGRAARSAAKVARRRRREAIGARCVAARRHPLQVRQEPKCRQQRLGGWRPATPMVAVRSPIAAQAGELRERLRRPLMLVVPIVVAAFGAAYVPR